MLTSKGSAVFLVILAWICISEKCHADIGAQRQYRLQHQRQQIQSSMPYPAAGYRPGRQFILPQQQEEPQQQQDHDESNTHNINPEDSQQQARRPHSNYEAPNVAPQSARLIQEFQPQQYFLPASPVQRHKSERLTATAAKSARLAINSEAAQEDDEDEIASDIEVDKQTDNVPRTTQAVANPQSSTVYYPAGAVSFVQPLPAAAIPQPAAAVIAQPAAVNYLQQLQYASFQVQPVAAAAAAPAHIYAPAASSAIVQPTAAKLAVQPVSAPAQALAPASAPAVAVAAKLEAQPVTATTLAAAAAPAPAPYFAASGFYATPTAAAYTAPFVQPQFYVPAATAAMAQLQAW